MLRRRRINELELRKLSVIHYEFMESLTKYLCLYFSLLDKLLSLWCLSSIPYLAWVDEKKKRKQFSLSCYLMRLKSDLVWTCGSILIIGFY